MASIVIIPTLSTRLVQIHFWGPGSHEIDGCAVHESEGTVDKSVEEDGHPDIICICDVSSFDGKGICDFVDEQNEHELDFERVMAGDEQYVLK